MKYTRTLHFSYPMYTIFALAVLLMLSVVVDHAESNPGLIPRSQIYDVPTLPPRTSTTKRTLRCVCEDDDGPVCASNGVTYTSPCRYECAKKKVPRLRIVKQGSCAGLMKTQYWNSKSG